MDDRFFLLIGLGVTALTVMGLRDTPGHSASEGWSPLAVAGSDFVRDARCTTCHRPGGVSSEITTLATRGLDGLDPYFARYLPQLALACLVPLAVVVRVALADWVSALIIALTLPLIPVFTVLVGRPARARARRQWLLLARLGGHFLDVVEGLTTLKVFGRARPQAEVIGQVTDAHRTATMSVGFRSLPA